jgi:glycosidase
MLLLSGKNLQATHVSCNLREVVVSRTQSTADGSYLFVWLKFAPELKPGTSVCRITTARGQGTFELPIAARSQILGRNQGLALDDVIYEIVPDRFANGDVGNDEPPDFPGSHDRRNPQSFHGGDFRGIQEHLGYLKDLGVTTLALTSILKNSASPDHQSNSAVDLYEVDPHYGTIGEYRELVRAAHQQHLKMLFATSPNVVGPAHPWVMQPPAPDWFAANPEKASVVTTSLPGAFKGRSGNGGGQRDALELLADPHTPPQLRRDLIARKTTAASFALNTENPLLMQYLVQNGMWWAESTGLDGYSIAEFPYASRNFWEEWHTRLRRIYPRLSTIGEVPQPDPIVTSFYQGGRTGWDGVDTQLTTLPDFPLSLALRDILLNGAAAGKVEDILRQDSLYPHAEFLVPFLEDANTPRFTGMAEGTPARLKLGLGLLLTVRGIPELEYGDEIGLAGISSADNHPDFPGGWSGDENNAFQKAGRSRGQQDIFEFVEGLLQLRAVHPALRRGRLWNLASDDATYVFLRETDEEKLVVAFHSGNSGEDMMVSLGETSARVAANAMVLVGPGQVELLGKKMKLHLPAQSLTVFSLQ